MTDHHLSDPRQRLLRLIRDRRAPICTAELASASGQTLGVTAHHVRGLERAGLIDWAGERSVDGALRTFFVLSDAGLGLLHTDEASPPAPLDGLDAQARAQLAELSDEVAERDDARRGATE